MMNKVIFFCICIVLLMGCKQYKTKPDKEQEAITTINVNPEINRKISIDDLYSDYQFIRLETNENSLISFVNKLVIYQGRIYIYDNKLGGSIFCFNNQGKFLYKIANHGQGPGETVFIMDFSINKNNNTLWIGDDARKILKYDLDGNFIKEYKTDFSINNIACIDSNDDLFALRFGYYKNKSYGVAIYSLLEEKIIDHRMYPTNFERIIGGESMSFYGKNLLYCFGFTDTLYQVTTQNFIPRYAFDFGKHKVSKNIFSDKDNKNIIIELEKASNAYAGLITNAIKSEKYLIFKYDYCGEHQITIYSDSVKNVINISKIIIDGKENPVSRFLIYNEGDTYFSVVAPHLLVDTEDEGGKQVEPYGIYQNINQLKANLKPDDNPVVIVGKINYDLLFK